MRDFHSVIVALREAEGEAEGARMDLLKEQPLGFNMLASMYFEIETTINHLVDGIFQKEANFKEWMNEDGTGDG